MRSVMRLGAFGLGVALISIFSVSPAYAASFDLCESLLAQHKPFSLKAFTIELRQWTARRVELERTHLRRDWYSTLPLDLSAIQSDARLLDHVLRNEEVRSALDSPQGMLARILLLRVAENLEEEVKKYFLLRKQTRPDLFNRFFNQDTYVEMEEAIYVAQEFLDSFPLIPTKSVPDEGAAPSALAPVSTREQPELSDELIENVRRILPVRRTVSVEDPRLLRARPAKYREVAPEKEKELLEKVSALQKLMHEERSTALQSSVAEGAIALDQEAVRKQLIEEMQRVHAEIERLVSEDWKGNFSQVPPAALTVLRFYEEDYLPRTPADDLVDYIQELGYYIHQVRIHLQMNVVPTSDLLRDFKTARDSVERTAREMGQSPSSLPILTEAEAIWSLARNQFAFPEHFKEDRNQKKAALSEQIEKLSQEIDAHRNRIKALRAGRVTERSFSDLDERSVSDPLRVEIQHLSAEIQLKLSRKLLLLSQLRSLRFGKEGH